VALVSAGVLTLGILLGAGTPGGPDTARPVYADACKSPNAGCFGDGTKTSAVLVTHVYDPQSTNQAVEPNTGESITIDVYWNTNNVPCDEDHEQASADVDWNSASDTWVLSNVNLTTHVIDIDVCDVASLDCSTVTDGHSYGYKLIVDITDAYGGDPHHLRQVVYTTTAVDDGYLLNLGTCALGAAQTVNSQTWTATDNGAFECAYNCSQNGTSMVIEY
jgi:hypothetical protein